MTEDSDVGYPVRTIAGFAILAGTGAAITHMWLAMAIFFVVGAFTPEVCARLHHRRFYFRGRARREVG